MVPNPAAGTASSATEASGAPRDPCDGLAALALSSAAGEAETPYSRRAPASAALEPETYGQTLVRLHREHVSASTVPPPPRRSDRGLQQPVAAPPTQQPAASARAHLAHGNVNAPVDFNNFGRALALARAQVPNPFAMLSRPASSGGRGSSSASAAPYFGNIFMTSDGTIAAGSQNETFTMVPLPSLLLPQVNENAAGSAFQFGGFPLPANEASHVVGAPPRSRMWYPVVQPSERGDEGENFGAREDTSPEEMRVADYSARSNPQPSSARGQDRRPHQPHTATSSSPSPALAERRRRARRRVEARRQEFMHMEPPAPARTPQPLDNFSPPPGPDSRNFLPLAFPVNLPMRTHSVPGAAASNGAAAVQLPVHPSQSMSSNDSEDFAVPLVYFPSSPPRNEGISRPRTTVANRGPNKKQHAEYVAKLEEVRQHVAKTLAEVSEREEDLFAVVNARLQNSASPTDELALRNVKAKLIAMLDARADMAEAWAKVVDEAESAVAGIWPSDKARKGNAAELEDVECVIDLSNIERGEEVIRLPCMHVFHKECIMPYLQRENVPLCPIDRSPVPKRIVPLLPVWKWRC